jgi:HEAT repeat protein
MKRTLRMSAGVLAGLGLLAVGTWILSRSIGTHETRFQGKPVRYWSDQLANHDAVASNEAAAVVYSKIVPHLTNQMFTDTNDSKFRQSVIDELNTLPGIQIDSLDAVARRAQAVTDLGSLGPSAKSAAPALLEALKGTDDAMCAAAATALAKIQVDAATAVPALIGCLIDRKGHGRPDVVDALGEYGPPAKAAVPMLVTLLKDRSSKDLIKAVPHALRRIDPEAAAAAGVRAPAPKPAPSQPSVPPSSAAAAGSPPPSTSSNSPPK